MGKLFLQILDMGEGSVKEAATYFAMFYCLGIEFFVPIGTKNSIKYLTSQENLSIMLLKKCGKWP